MGTYTQNLFSKKKKAFRERQNTKAGKASVRLVSCAVVRNGIGHQGFKSHAELRRTLGDENPYESNPLDQEGFMTSEGKFVTRHEAIQIGVGAGQCSPQGRPLLSSDISW